MLFKSEDLYAKVLVDKDSPYLKSIILNKGSKNNVKIGMAVVDNSYLVGKIIEVNYINSHSQFHKKQFLHNLVV